MRIKRDNIKSDNIYERTANVIKLAQIRAQSGQARRTKRFV